MEKDLPEDRLTLAGLLCSYPETALSHCNRSISVDLGLDFAQAGTVLIDRESWNHPRDGFQAPSKSADIADDLSQGRRGVFEDAQARAFELAGQPRRPATLRIGLRTVDPEEPPVLAIVARVHLLRDEPPSRDENARDLVDVEALVAVHDQMESVVRERKRRSGAFQRLAGVVPRRCDLDDDNSERPQTRCGNRDVRPPGLGRDGPRRPIGQLREPLTAARTEIEQVGRTPRVLDNCGCVVPRQRLRVESASEPAEIPADERLALGLIKQGVDPVWLAAHAHRARQVSRRSPAAREMSGSGRTRF